MKPDIDIEIRFKKSEEGGRQSPIVGDVYGCPMIIDGEAFECRLVFENKILQLGVVNEVSVKFMNPDLVLPKLSIGKKITLWEGKEVASGKVLRFL